MSDQDTKKAVRVEQESIDAEYMKQAMEREEALL